MGVQVVWFKRDLRCTDHAPLVAAAARGPVLPLYVVEPELWEGPDMAARHWQLLRQALLGLEQELARLGAPLQVFHGEISEILSRIHTEIGISAVFSHQETGNAWTYARDQRVAHWLRDHGIPWHEFPQDGVVRPLTSRNRWQSQRDAYMARPLIDPVSTLGSAPRSRDALDQWPELATPSHAAPLEDRIIGPATPSAAMAQLEDFLAHRYSHYLSGMSSPLSAGAVCSRLSPFLSLGIISTRQAVQRIHAAQQGSRQRGYQALQARLAWRGHFMQKLEDQPELETTNVQRSLDGLREAEFNPQHFAAWCQGETGFPLVDACMRALIQTGWLNFRMRALLVSFSAYALWLHWREPALHLARLFVDYEPGIHYPQVQMQAGTTGINALRIYNVNTQAETLDPEGTFIRRWIPELAQVPAPWIQRPWRLPPGTAKRYGLCLGRDYPEPIVDFTLAVRQAKARVVAARRQEDARQEAAAILQRHGSRKRQKPRKARGPDKDPQQLSFW